jgi:hypothetical protein
MAKENYKIEGDKLIVNPDVAYKNGIPLEIFNYAVKNHLVTIQVTLNDKVISFPIQAILSNEQETECGRPKGKEEYLFLRGTPLNDFEIL